MERKLGSSLKAQARVWAQVKKALSLNKPRPINTQRGLFSELAIGKIFM